ncbi:MAG: D-alanine--D-alanine ligase [Pseudomonadota bacterium]
MADLKQKFGRVAVVMGGISAEREISLQSGNAVLTALQSLGVDAYGVDLTPDSLHEFMAERFDRVFVMLHGRWGEDGLVQGFLDTLGMPYTGSGVMGCAIAMDKIRSKQIFQSVGIPTADFRVADNTDELTEIADTLGLPLFMKPSREGSSVGVGKVNTHSELAPVWQRTQRFGDEVVIEKFIAGDELTVAILDGKALPVIRMTPANEFYDFDAKYKSSETRYECPADIPPALEKQLKSIAESAFAALGCETWGRVDIMLTADGEPQVLEVNTVPGMTETSLVPRAAAATGLDFPALCLKVLSKTLETRSTGGSHV